MFKKTFVSTIAMMYAFVVQAQSDSAAPPPALSITGSADLYYKYDFSKSRGNNLTSFTNSHNRFELGMATVKIEHKTAKLDVVADLGFGKRAREFNYTDDNGNTSDIVLSTIKQMYISYAPAAWVKFTAGTWATHVGYELVDAYLNRNYSMSYMFTNGPFSHTGFKVDLTAGKSGFMLGIANPTDFKYVPDGVINKKFLLAQYSLAASENVKIYLNYVGGQGIDTSKSSQFDAVVTAKLGDKFSIGYNGTVNSTKLHTGNNRFNSAKTWWGSALYLNLDPTSSFGLTLRGEYFSDKNQLKVYSGFGEGGTVFATTLSANFKLNSFIFIPEFRLDNASKDLFVKSNGSATSSSGSFLLAAIYSF
ncbi:MAG: outer membrane beta-barrel protein [Chitinophagaceae bacterium]